MKTLQVSDKGQITLPAEMRRRFGLKSRSRVAVEVRDNEIVLKPMKSILDLAGCLHEYAKGKSTDWETIRAETMRIAAEEGTGDKLNW